MLVTKFGIVKSPVKLVPEKAHSPIDSTLLPIVRVPIKPVQPLKASSPILVTESGIAKAPVSYLLLAKALSAILVTGIPSISANNIRLTVSSLHPFI
jgi:hypothetical protein